MEDYGDKGAVFNGQKQIGAFRSWELKTVTEPLVESGGLRQEVFKGWTASARRFKFVEPPEGKLRFMFFSRSSWKETSGEVTGHLDTLTMEGVEKPKLHRPEAQDD